MDEDGTVHSEWVDIIKISQRHFVRLLGTSPLVNEEVMQRRSQLAYP